jgi:hypothetical protein
MIFCGELLIHDSRNVDPEGFRWLQKNFPELHTDRQKLQYGAIIGYAKMINCVNRSESPWFFGSYGFVLTNSVLFENPIPYKGSMKLFDLPDKLIAHAASKNNGLPGNREYK